MEDAATRLKETSETCLKALEAWTKDKKDASAKEALSEAVHELRKVCARVEIDMAVSDSAGKGKAIPIPAHRSSRPKSDGGDKGGNQESKGRISGGARRKRSSGEKDS